MTTDEINWDLIQKLTPRPHPLLHIADDLREVPEAWLGEVMQEARTAHHLLDLAGIPRGKGDAAKVDARTYLILSAQIDLRDRLDRIAGWHSRESGAGGTVGDFCNECGNPWPCDTQRMAVGTYEDRETT